MQVFSRFEGFLLIAGYGILCWAVIAFMTRREQTKQEFLLASREIGRWPAAFSIAATWIWAPALFLAAQKAFTQGWPGVFWFTVPNVACLIVFAHFAGIIREKVPEGYTLSGYMLERHSGRVHNLYMLQFVGLAACSFAVQLLAGGAVISGLTGIPFLWVTVMLSVIALSYSWFSGMRASVVTDHFQMVLIAAIGFLFVPWAVARAGGIASVISGLSGRTGTFSSLFAGDGGAVFLSFGIPVTIGLMAGPFGDQSFWQRAFSTRRDQVRSAFVWGALIFGTVPVLMSLLGFIAAGKGLAVKDAQLVNLEAVLAYLPAWTVVPFTYMLLSGLVSTLDSNLCALASLVGHDVVNRSGGHRESVSLSRSCMVVFCMAAIVIANIPGMKILYLFLFYGTLRASTLLPTVLTILKDRISEPGMFWGILVAILFGLPIFAYGNFTHNTPAIIFGSLFTVCVSGLIVWISTYEASEKAGIRSESLA